MAKGWDERDIPLDEAVCEIIGELGQQSVRLCFRLDGESFEIEEDQLPARIREAFRELI